MDWRVRARKLEEKWFTGSTTRRRLYWSTYTHVNAHRTSHTLAAHIHSICVCERRTATTTAKTHLQTKTTRVCARLHGGAYKLRPVCCRSSAVQRSFANKQRRSRSYSVVMCYVLCARAECGVFEMNTGYGDWRRHRRARSDTHNSRRLADVRALPAAIYPTTLHTLGGGHAKAKVYYKIGSDRQRPPANRRGGWRQQQPQQLIPCSNRRRCRSRRRVFGLRNINPTTTHTLHTTTT